jgi:hypothetical protein
LVQLAKTVQGVTDATDRLISAIRDRTMKIDEVCVRSVAERSLFGWRHRHPSMAFDKGILIGSTDLDALSLMGALASRHPVIELADYEARLARVVRKGERRISGVPHFGRVHRLVANKEVFSFSLLLTDVGTVVEEEAGERTGSPRSLMFVDCDGNLRPECHRLTFKPDAPENAFFAEWGIADEKGRVPFKTAVHRNRWQAIFGAPYLSLKYLIIRLEDEAAHCKRELKRLAGLGIRYCPESTPKQSEGRSQTIPVDTLVVEVDLPDFIGAYASFPHTIAGARAAYRRLQEITRKLIPMALVVVRADELAYFLHGGEKIAPWITGASWTPWRGYRCRTIWQKLQLTERFAIRLRRFTTTHRVAA